MKIGDRTNGVALVTLDIRAGTTVIQGEVEALDCKDEPL
jgi:hypothetical protein